MNAPITTDSVGSFITKMKSETSSAKLSQQLYAIPKRITNLLNGQVFEYYTNDRKRRIINPAREICISIDDVKFFSMVSRRYRRLQDSITPLIDLIEFHRIFPFILFLNGRFIPWENIDLVISYEKYYLLIHDLNDELVKLVRDVKSMDAIMFPTNLIYSIGVANNNLTSIFSFNNMGLYDTDDWTHNIYIENLEIDCIKFTNPSNILEFTSSANIEHFSENFFFFQDNLYDNKEVIIQDGYVSINGDVTEDTICIVLSNPKATMSIKNINIARYTNIKSDIATLLSDPENAPEYIKTLSQSFNFNMSKEDLYETNRYNALKYIMSYRQDLFIELYEKELDYFSIQVDLAWLQNHMDENGYLSISRRSSTSKDYYIIIMHNGELYKYYKHSYYYTNKFVCPIMSIEENDTVELLFFKNAMEYTLYNTITENDPYRPLNEDYYNNRAKIFCKQTVDTYFEYPISGDQHFPVDYSLSYNDDGYIKILFDDTFYYGKEVIVSPDNTFKYFSYIMTEEDLAGYYKIGLGTKFNCCDEYDRYLVFYNGRRLNNDDYRLTIPCRSTTPFYKFEIYLTLPLELNDRLDIFYLPTKIKDIDLTIDMPADGKITIDKTLLPYMLDKCTYTFWINGKKIPTGDLTVVDGNTIQLIKDQQSTSKLRITAMGDPIDEIEKIYQEVDQSLWDKAISEGSYTSMLDIVIPNITNTEPDTYSGSVPVQSIMLELFREHYMNNDFVDITGNFIYGYKDVDNSIIGDEDPEGNSLIEAADAELRNNLDIERYYP